jgi:hypothetical protein
MLSVLQKAEEQLAMASWQSGKSEKADNRRS